MIRQVSKELIRFIGVGLLGLLVDVGFTVFFIELGLDALIARIFAIVPTMIVTWRLNRALTFGASDTSQATEGLRYFAVAIGVAFVNYCIYAILLLSFPTLPPALAVMIAVATATVLSFTGYRIYAFKTSA